MKVIINACYGGFTLSDEAILECIARGMAVTTYNAAGNYEDETADFVDRGEKNFGSRYSICKEYEKQKQIRTHPIILEVVEKLGVKANGSCSKLKIIDIPFDSLDGWIIHEYDGYESIKEEHQTWS